jgi:alpha-tubulin suppressor-like RCC1 family protein
MIVHKLLILIFLSLTLYSSQINFDVIELAKIKKLINKEEQIASAYKKYLIIKGKIPLVDDLIWNGIVPKEAYHLPLGVDLKDLFGNKITFKENGSEEFYTLANLPNAKNLKSTSIDEYLSNTNRVDTIAALSTSSHSQIKFTVDEKRIYDLISEVDKNTPTLEKRYYLDDNGVLHWYYALNDLAFSYANKKLILYNKIDSSNKIDSDVLKELIDHDFLTAGLILYNISNGVANEYLNIANDGILIKTGEQIRDIGKTIIQFTRRAGGMIVNGDLFTWGNTKNYGVSISDNSYTIGKKTDGTIINGTGSPIINVLVKAKIKTYIKDLGLTEEQLEDLNGDDSLYFSSPLRPKFTDFTSNVWQGTCGISTKGELYCGGNRILEVDYIDFEGYTIASGSSQELLYKSKFFDGTNHEAKRVFALLATYIVLDTKGDIYYWGRGDDYFINGTGIKVKNLGTPKKMSTEDINNVKFKDITYTLSIGYRRVIALSTQGDIYTWGLDTETTGIGQNNCEQILGEDTESSNLCKPLKIEYPVKFNSILSGQQTVLATDDEGLFYKISQAKGEKPKIESINTLIEEHQNYPSNPDEKEKKILSVDISSNFTDYTDTLAYGKGIVWVNGKHELKGDYFPNDYIKDLEFENAIKQIKWKIIRVIEDQNGMCGINTVNQMYCWGRMQYSGNYNKSPGNTYMLPIFNMNLHDLDKDFMFVQNNPTTPMTSSEWLDADGNYFVKYPTYIGGFNYEFEFK